MKKKADQKKNSDRASKNDSILTPKRGAFPTPKKDIENADQYVPDLLQNDDEIDKTKRAPSEKDEAEKNTNK